MQRFIFNTHKQTKPLTVHGDGGLFLQCIPVVGLPLRSARANTTVVTDSHRVKHQTAVNLSRPCHVSHVRFVGAVKGYGGLRHRFATSDTAGQCQGVTLVNKALAAAAVDDRGVRGGI